MKIKKELIKREIAGDTILVPAGKTVYDSNGLYVLTDVAAFIWDRLDAAQTEEDIVSQILEEYDVSEEIAIRDTKEFLSQLRKMEII